MANSCRLRSLLGPRSFPCSSVATSCNDRWLFLVNSSRISWSLLVFDLDLLGAVPISSPESGAGLSLRSIIWFARPGWPG